MDSKIWYTEENFWYTEENTSYVTLGKLCYMDDKIWYTEEIFWYTEENVQVMLHGGNSLGKLCYMDMDDTRRKSDTHGGKGGNFRRKNKSYVTLGKLRYMDDQIWYREEKNRLCYIRKALLRGWKHLIHGGKFLIQGGKNNLCYIRKALLHGQQNLIHGWNFLIHGGKIQVMLH